MLALGDHVRVRVRLLYERADAVRRRVRQHDQRCEQLWACSQPCSLANATAKCSASACAVASCSSGFADCDGTPSNGCEIDLGTNASHCGTCTTACSGGMTCQSGVCGCPSNFHSCSGTCVSNTAVATCGASCNACTAPTGGSATCNGTSCGTSCPAGDTVCSGACVNLNTSTSNCGSCGKACAGTCSSGTCTLPTVTAIAAGSQDSCALMSDGTVRCWGKNNDGQLGNGATADSSKPVAVSNLSGATAVAAGFYSACALLSGGTVECWGNNENGQLGNGSTTPDCLLVPVAVSSLTGVTAIATMAESQHTCALLSGGTVKCWGLNAHGEVGNGFTANATTPVAVSGLTGATAIAVGADDTCALLSGGTAKCWGFNNFGQLENTTMTTSSTPVNASELQGATAIVAGGNHTCALMLGSAWRFAAETIRTGSSATDR